MARPFRLGDLHVDGLDLRRRWALSQQIDQLVDRGLIAFQMPFDAAIQRVSNPAGDAKIASPLRGPGSEEYPLNRADNSDIECYLRH